MLKQIIKHMKSRFNLQTTISGIHSIFAKGIHSNKVLQTFPKGIHLEKVQYPYRVIGPGRDGFATIPQMWEKQSSPLTKGRIKEGSFCRDTLSVSEQLTFAKGIHSNNVLQTLKALFHHFCLIIKSINLRSHLPTTISITIILLFLTWLFWPMDSPFPENYSTLIYDCNGQLLRAFLADDEQLRFPPDTTSLPEKYLNALVTCEDRRFFSHPGIDPLALLNSFYTNIKMGKRIRGGSTIPMQIIRLANPKKRTYLNKLLECFSALKLSLHFSKQQLLKLYAAHVPMGGNIVGIHAASYAYFGKPAKELSWAEAGLLTVLPNSPSMINLSRGRQILMGKRNRLLLKLYQKDIIDQLSYQLACMEPLPDHYTHLPFHAPHFTRFIEKDSPKNSILTTTLDLNIQQQLLDAVSIHHPNLSNSDIANLAVMAVETQTGKIRAYIGSQSYYDTLHAGEVDGIQSYRSTGSLLKPFLAAKALDRGPFTMSSLIQDVPTFYGTFTPQNASKEFKGLVSMEEMLIHSLNVPAVRLLNTYGVQDFYDFLIQANFKGLFRSPAEYGLTLILGGAEARLWELVELYLALGKLGQYMPLQYLEKAKTGRENRLFSEGAAWLVLNTLNKVNRPGIEYYWHQFNNQVPVAWKTGTSYGQKDGWAIGVNKQWIIGVWVGNFSGEGNALLTGAKSAAPLLFTIFNALTDYNQSGWFEEPEYDLAEIEVCRVSGYPANSYCPEKIKVKRPVVSHKAGVCPYHRRYLVDRKSGKSVCSLCWQGIDTTWVTKFIVPASVCDILQKSGKHADAIPLHYANCPAFQDQNRLELIYPVPGIKIFIPRDFDGNYEKIVFSAKHQHPSINLFWYLDGSFLGETTMYHQLAVDLKSGAHKLVVQDEEGFQRSVSFSAYKKN
jgi:penicillin-binding protein 1C